MSADILQALLDWNPWLEQSTFPLELLGFPRDYHLLDYLKVPEIKILEGGRRVGKSTLMYQVMHNVLLETKNILYINFEDEVLKKYTLADIVHAYQSQNSVDYLFVDEIQNCIDWVTFVRKMYDRHELKQIWVSGSNASFIKSEYATLLTGRNLTIIIFPLSFHEFLRFKGIINQSLVLSKKQQAIIQRSFVEYMDYGAFPAVVNRDVLKKDLLLAYFNDFIYKDIVARYQVDAEKIKEFAIYLATQTTKIFSYRSVAKMLNCHINTITDYLGYLKSVFLFEELYKFDYSLKKQISNDKKIYCLDTGIAAAVSFRFSEEKGRILENIIFNELRRRQKNIYFHKNKFECDFLIKQELKIVEVIQVCVTLQDEETRVREIKGILEPLKLYQLEEGTIITMDEAGEEWIEEDGKRYRLKIIPAWRWLLAS